MKGTIKRKVSTISILLCAVVVLLVGMALPVSASTTTSSTGIQTVQGKVTSVTPTTSFVIQNGNQTPITIYVDPNTLYFAVPQGKSLNSLKSNDDNKNNNDDKGRKGNLNKQVLPGKSKGMPIPSNWRSDLGWLSIFDVQSTFSNIQVGDTIIARIQTSGNLAKQVLIIKAPAIQQVNGTISAINGNTITITQTTGFAIPVTWDANTQVTIKGQIALQVGQYAVVVYNRTNMIAQTIRAQLSSPTPTPTNVLSSISVTPAPTATLSVGLSQQYTAIGTYSNGTTQNISAMVNWTSSNTAVATINPTTGLAAGVAAGSTNITASHAGKTSPAVTLNVIAGTLTSIAVTPASPANLQVAATQQFIAIGSYSNGMTQNINSQVTWTSSNTAAATISTAGLATGVAVGSTNITASLFGVTSPPVTLNVVTNTLTSIAVTPTSPANLLVSATQQFTAIGSYSNGTTQNISTMVTWTSSNTAVATITSTGLAGGLATGVAPGSSNITASYIGITSPAVALNVVTPTLISIAVTPASTVTLHGTATQQFIATGFYSNGTTQNISTMVTWTSSNTAVATITSTGLGGGLATGVAPGSTNITAFYTGITSPAVILNVVTP